MRLAGKVAIITGAGRGMGAAGARLFAAEGAGVVIADYRAEAAGEVAREVESAGGQALAIEGDVTRSSDVERLVSSALQRFGKIDVLWNNVGGVGWRPTKEREPLGRSSIVDTSEEEWDWMMALNVKSAYLCSKAVIPHMVANGGGSIISTSSAPALTGHTSGTHAYVVAKGGIVSLGKLIAHTWGRQGIRSNVILPGLIDSHTSGNLSDTANRVTALGRLGSMDEVAKVALFFASDESAYVTGETLLIDGGAAVWREAQRQFV